MRREWIDGKRSVMADGDAPRLNQRMAQGNGFLTRGNTFGVVQIPARVLPGFEYELKRAISVHRTKDLENQRKGLQATGPEANRFRQ